MKFIKKDIIIHTEYKTDEKKNVKLRVF